MCQSNVQWKRLALTSPAQNAHPTSAQNALHSPAQCVHVSALRSHALKETTLALTMTALGSTNVSQIVKHALMLNVLCVK